MKITDIKASAGRTFNHPYEQYANFRFDIHLSAELEEGEDGVAKLKELQAMAEQQAEDHKRSLLVNIRNLEKLARANEEISQLEDRVRSATERLGELKKAQRDLSGVPELPFHAPAPGYDAGEVGRAQAGDDEDDDAPY